MLHCADCVAVNLGNSFRIFKESEQAVATHIKKIVGNVRVGWRADAVTMARAQRARRRPQSVYDRHAQDAHIEVECHPHVIGDKGEVMDPTQHWFTASSRDLARTGSRCNRRDAHAVPPSLSQQVGYHRCLIAATRSDESADPLERDQEML